LTTYFFNLRPQILKGAVTVCIICQIAYKVTEHSLSIPLIDAVPFTQGGESMFAIMWRVLLDVDPFKG
jgi:hypothetical protein